MAANNFNLVMIGDSTTAEVYGQSLDPRNRIAHKITTICPVNVNYYGAVGLRMSRFPGYSYEHLSLPDNRNGVRFLHGFFGSIHSIFVCLGINDWMNGDSKSLARYRNECRKTAAYLKKYEIPNIVFCSPLWTIDLENDVNTGGFTLQNFRDVNMQVASEYSILFMDGKTVVPQNQLYFNGSMHLNDAGHPLAAQNICSYMQAAEIFPQNY